MRINRCDVRRACLGLTIGAALTASCGDCGDSSTDAGAGDAPASDTATVDHAAGDRAGVDAMQRDRMVVDSRLSDRTGSDLTPRDRPASDGRSDAARTDHGGSDSSRDAAADAGAADVSADAGPPPPVNATEQGDHWSLDNSIVYARAYASGQLEVGRAGQLPWVMDRDPEDHDVICVFWRCDNLGPDQPATPAGAATIAQTIVINGETCVRTTFTGVPRNDDGHQLVPSAIALTWDVCLRPGSDQVSVRLSATGEAVGADLSKLYFPYSPRLADDEAGYAVLPLWHGLLLPVGWLVPSPLWTYVDGGGGVFHTEWQALSNGWGMPFYGMVAADGRALLVELRTPADAALRVHQVQGRAPRVTPLWYAARDRFDAGGVREIVYTPLVAGDHVALAQRYRARMVETGRHVSLEQKRAQRPALDSLIGGAMVAATSCYYQKSTASMIHDRTFEQVQQQINQAAAAGNEPLARGLVHLDGWGQRGYDNLHPDVVLAANQCRPVVDGSPDCGPCDWAGGWSGLRALNDGLASGWLLELHDNYRDFYLDAPSYGTGCPDCITDWTGGLPPPNDAWAGGPNQVLCASRALGYLQRNLTTMQANGVVPTAMYLDVFTAAGPDQCYSSAHPMLRAASLTHRATLFDELRARGQVVASEQLVDWSIPHLDHVYWSNHLRQYQPADPDPRRRPGDSFYPSPVGVPAPLIELVYHDAVVVPWPVAFGEREEVLLDAWLNAGMPQIGIDRVGDARARREVRELMALQRAIGTLPMTSHAYLDDRFMTERAVFGGNATTTIDRDRWTTASANIAGVSTGPRAPATSYRVSARVVSAVGIDRDTLRLTIEWRSDDDLRSLPAHTVFAHAVFDDGTIIANGDHAPPAATTTWNAGTTLVDGPFDLNFNASGTATLVVGLYDTASAGAPRLPVLTPRWDQALPLGQTTVGGPSIGVDLRPHAEVRLVLARQSGDLTVEVMTEWRVDRPLPAGQRIFFHAVAADETIVANADYEPAIPVEQWPVQGRRRELRRQLAFDAGEVPGDYRLVTGMFDPMTGPNFDRLDFAEADAARRLVLGTLRIAGTGGHIDSIRFCPAEVAGCL